MAHSESVKRISWRPTTGKVHQWWWHESSSEEENGGGTIGLNDHDSDPEGFDNNVNSEDDKFTLDTSNLEKRGTL